jgi:hypothetical protein
MHYVPQGDSRTKRYGYLCVPQGDAASESLKEDNMSGFIFKHMPEDFPFDTSEQKKGEELDQLRPQLEGNKVFGRSRGTWNISQADVAEKLLDNYETIDELNEQADRVCKDFKIMLLMQHRLMLRGQYWARRELVQALQEQYYLLPGENFPLEETEPVTMLVYEPDITLPLIQWIVTADHCFLFQLLDKRDLENLRSTSHNFEHSLALSQKLLESLPSLPALLDHRKHDWDSENKRHVLKWESKILAAYYLDVVSKYPLLSKGKSIISADKNFRLSWDVKKVLNSFRPGEFESVDYRVLGSLVFLEAGLQKEVLSKFSRDQQKHVATWQFVVPKCIDWSYQKVGLHQESEHEEMRRQRMSLVSKGLAAGFGAMIVPGRDVSLYPETNSFEYSPGTPFRFLFD